MKEMACELPEASGVRAFVAHAADGPTPGPDEVDIWCVSLDDQFADEGRTMESLISADELLRARGFHFERDRRRYVVGRAVLRDLLGCYLQRSPRVIEFCYGPYGKPAIAANGLPADGKEQASSIHFNVAHSEGLALCVFSRGSEVGVDLEFVRDLPDWEQVAELAFSATELVQLRAVAAEHRRDHFFQAWTRQEARLKAIGTGLTGGASTTSESEFRVYPLHVVSGFAAAVAVATGIQWATMRDWRTAGAMEVSSAPEQTRRIRLSESIRGGTNFL